MGRFNYASNANNGFGLASVFEDEFRIEIKGIEVEPMRITDLYTVSIKRS